MIKSHPAKCKELINYLMATPIGSIAWSIETQECLVWSGNLSLEEKNGKVKLKKENINLNYI